MAARQAGAFGLVVVAGAAGGIGDALVEKPWPRFPGDEGIPGARSFRTVDGTGGSGRSVRDLLFDLAFGFVARRRQHHLMVLRREMRRKQAH